MITQLIKVEKVSIYYEVFAYDVTENMMVSCGIYSKKKNVIHRCKAMRKHFTAKATAVGVVVPVKEYIPLLQIHL